MANRDAPKSVIKRLPVYLRILDNLIRRDIEIISSRELSEETGFTAEQIRKDLAYFGAFGTRGAGYNANFLREKILKIIGLHKKTSVIVVGAGHLGKALTRYNMIKNPYVEIVGIFDNDPAIIGESLNSLTVKDVNDMPEIIKKQKIKVGIVTVPEEHAQSVVDSMVKSGIKAILNFAPTKLDVPEGVQVHNADLTIELQSLIYYASTAED
ncbi:MAG: redox-sensing transcriptional repressor Rex [Firmicutes bacterium]|nr:redox-sensing transcriptional repressor Rex [Bacillota bacterium]